MSGQRACIYARYSTDLQDGRSIDDQVALCRDHAARHGLTVVAVYDDRAKTSASIFGRDGLARMLEGAKARAFDVVLVEALDRLSRDQEDLSHIHKRLAFAKIDILTVHEGKADAVSVGLRGLMGTLFLDALRQKTRRGLAGVIRDGRHAGGLSYGYRGVPGKPGEREIVAHEAEIIREIFRAYAGGESPRSIAGRLNAQGVPPPRGASWNASSLNGQVSRGYGILRNPMYDGRLIWNRVTMVRDPDTGKRVNRENPRDQWQEVSAEHLRIVPPELFQAAMRHHESQTHKVINKQATRAPARPFSGLIRCGVCGGPMAIHDRAGAAIRIRCSRATESGSCDNKGRFRLDRIEVAIFDRLRDQLARPEYLKAFVQTYAAERRRLAEDGRRDRAQLERAASEAQGRYMRLVDMMARGLIEGADADRQVLDAKSAARQAQAALAEASEPETVIELHPLAANAYGAAITSLARSLERGGEFDAEAVAALRQIITQIIVRPGAGRCDAHVDVMGRMTALLGLPDEIVGGAVVARGRFERSPHLLMTVRCA